MQKNASLNDSLPLARVRRRRRSALWLIPVIALTLATSLVISALNQRGIPISIELQQGHGLKPGDALRYRGIIVGTVKDVALSKDLRSIEVSVLLERSARDLARAGSQFWVVRPQVDISGATGLKTIIGANYLGVIPGEGVHQSRFQGLSQPPLLAVLEAGGLEIILTTPGMENLRAGAPISYRQVVIGKIISVDLARDASAVEARAYIRPEYTSLIRQRTRFWKVSGARWSAGLTGISFNVDSLGSLMLGGITLAIPPDPGQPVPQSHRFRLHDEPQRDWLEWLPFVALDAQDETSGLLRPQPIQATLRWRHKNYLFITRDASRYGWVLPIDGGVLGPSDILTAPENALAKSVRLRIADQDVVLGNARSYAPGLTFLPVEHDLKTWPDTRKRTPESTEDTLIIADPKRPVRFVSADHVRATQTYWSIAPEVPFDGAWHGASVISDKDGELIGILMVTADRVEIARFLPITEVDAAVSASDAAEGSRGWWHGVMGIFSDNGD